MNHENRYGLLRKIFDAMPSMVFAVDDDVSIQEYNKAAADFLLMERPAIFKHRGGEVLHCIHATEAKEGCGHAPFLHARAGRHGSTVRRKSKIEEITNGKK